MAARPRSALETSSVSRNKRANLIRRDGRTPEGSQPIQHGPIGDADAFTLIVGPGEIDAEGNQDLAPAGKVDRLGVGQYAVEVEKDGIEHSDQLNIAGTGFNIINVISEWRVRPAPLVWRGLLRVVDDQDLNGSLCGFQLQTELFLESGDE